MMTIELGDTARDQITGFTGVVVSRHEYLNGCTRLELQPAKLKDDKPIASEVFDIQQLDLVKKTGARKATRKPPGGPYAEPKRPSIPQR